MLTFAVLWWSVFTAVTAVAASLFMASLVGILGSLIVVRFLIGVGEAAGDGEDGAVALAFEQGAVLISRMEKKASAKPQHCLTSIAWWPIG